MPTNTRQLRWQCTDGRVLRARVGRGGALGLVGLVGVLGCHDLSGLAGTQSLPAGTPDPSVYHTPAGALALYQNATTSFQFSYGASSVSPGSGGTATNPGVFVDYVFESGLLTDELQAGNLGCRGLSCVLSDVDLLDARQLSSAYESRVYPNLQGIRNAATLGIGALATYDPTASPALRGHLYALAGYAELMLADLFCSGVPLGHITFNGDFSYAPSSTTRQVYQAALAQFDTALTLSNDSARIMGLAWVGKARALVAVDDFAQAAQAAAHVPDAYAYQFLVDWSADQSGNAGTLFTSANGSGVTEADHEGLTGLPYISGGDPRSAAQEAASPNSPNQYGVSQYVPVKYGGATPGIFPIAVASGTEARLIRAEADLQPPTDLNDFLVQLNAARALAAPSLPPLPADSVPGTDSGRVTLLFRERAYDLFLTGHRQGDLRRLLRAPYNRSPEQTYPTGLYLGLSAQSSYGSSVSEPIDQNESIDPLFHGCLAQ